MSLAELKALLEKAKEDKEVQGYLTELKKFTDDDVKKYLESENGKKFHQPILDSYATKSLKTWQEKNLEKIKDDAIAASKNETPEQKAIRELNEKLIASELSGKREKVRNKALQELQTKSLPVELLDLVATANDEDGVIVNVSKVSDVFKTYSEKLNADFQSKNGRKPFVPGQQKLTKEMLKTMTREQISQFSEEEIDAVLAMG